MGFIIIYCKSEEESFFKHVAHINSRYTFIATMRFIGKNDHIFIKIFDFRLKLGKFLNSGDENSPFRRLDFFFQILA